MKITKEEYTYYTVQWSEEMMLDCKASKAFNIISDNIILMDCNGSFYSKNTVTQTIKEFFDKKYGIGKHYIMLKINGRKVSIFDAYKSKIM